MHEFLEFIFSNVEVFGLAVPMLWFAAAGLIVAAVALKAWSTAAVVALLAAFPYMVPLIKP